MPIWQGCSASRQEEHVFLQEGWCYLQVVLVEKELDKVVESNVLLMSDKEFLNELKQDKELGFAIIVKPREEPVFQQVVVPEEVKQLLE